MRLTVLEVYPHVIDYTSFDKATAPAEPTRHLNRHGSRVLVPDSEDRHN